MTRIRKFLASLFRSAADKLDPPVAHPMNTGGGGPGEEGRTQ